MESIKPECTGSFSDALICGDNLAVLKTIPDSHIDLCYADPPFMTQRDYSYGDSRSKSAIKAGTPGTTAFADTFIDTNDYIENFMRPRLAEIRRVLKPKGSLYLHCDANASHYLKILLDDVFGASKFVADIIWKRSYSHNNSRSWGRVIDNILCYGAGVINPDAVRVPGDNVKAGKYVFKEEGTGRKYTRAPLTIESRGGGHRYEFRGHERDWRITHAEMLALEKANGLHHLKPESLPMRKLYVDENPGKIPPNLWTDIEPLSSTAKERVEYPTQKPLALLERIVLASSNEGDLVLDPFLGSGTAAVAAAKHGRRYLGIDANPEAVSVTRARLDALANDNDNDNDDAPPFGLEDDEET